MEIQTTIILTWIIIGTLNTILLWYITQKYPEKINPKLPQQAIAQVGVLIVWFSFAFIIIPYIIIKYLRIYLIYKIDQTNNYLEKLVDKIKNKK